MVAVHKRLAGCVKGFHFHDRGAENIDIHAGARETRFLGYRGFFGAGNNDRVDENFEVPDPDAPLIEILYLDGNDPPADADLRSRQAYCAFACQKGIRKRPNVG